jgi:hypothetical protein
MPSGRRMGHLSQDVEQVPCTSQHNRAEALPHVRGLRAPYVGQPFKAAVMGAISDTKCDGEVRWEWPDRDGGAAL